jgi:S1-C subfamily serine protease
MKALSPILLFVVALFVLDVSAGEDPGRGGVGAKVSVFRVRCSIITSTGPRDGELGTAFGHKSGNVLSANHVVDPCVNASGNLQLVDSNGSVSSASVLISDAALDLVLLKLDDGFVKNPLPIASKDSFTIGAQVTRCPFRKSLPSLLSGQDWGLQSFSNKTHRCFP